MIIFLEQRTIDISIGWLDTCVGFPGTIIFLYLSWQIYKSMCVTPLHWSHWYTLQWRHNERDDISYHQSHDCLLNGLFRRRSKKTSKLRVTGLCEGNSPVTKGPVSRKIFPSGDVIMTPSNICRTDGYRIPRNEKVIWVGCFKPLKRRIYTRRDALK